MHYEEKWGRERGLRVLNGDMCEHFSTMTKEDLTRGDIWIMHKGHGRVSMWMSEAGVFLKGGRTGAKAGARDVFVKWWGGQWEQRTKWRASSSRWSQRVLEASHYLAFTLECDRSLMESLRWVVLHSPLDLQMSFWLLCGDIEWKAWRKNKQGNHSGAYAAILRRDDGGLSRTAAVEVERGGQILDVFWRYIQEVFLIVWTWITGSWITKDDSKVSFSISKNGHTIYL